MTHQASAESQIGSITSGRSFENQNLNQFLREMYDSTSAKPTNIVWGELEAKTQLVRQGALPSLEILRDSNNSETQRSSEGQSNNRFEESYTVKKGQGFYRIAKDLLSRSDVDSSPKEIMSFAKAIAEANGLDRDKSVIHPGQKLIIPTLEKGAKQQPRQSAGQQAEPRETERPLPLSRHPNFIPSYELLDEMPIPKESEGAIPPAEMPDLGGGNHEDVDPMPGFETPKPPMMAISVPDSLLPNAMKVKEVPAIDLESMEANTRPDGSVETQYGNSTITYWKDGAVRVTSSDGSGYSLTPSETNRNEIRIHHWGRADEQNFDMSYDCKSGIAIVKEKSGTTKTQWADGVTREEQADGTGFVSRPHYTGKRSEDHWGPKREDNYYRKPTPEGNPWSHVITQRSYAY